MAEAIPFKYRAFLSYSHRDTAWAKWLHARAGRLSHRQGPRRARDPGGPGAEGTAADLSRPRGFLRRSFAHRADARRARDLAIPGGDLLAQCGAQQIRQRGNPPLQGARPRRPRHPDHRRAASRAIRSANAFRRRCGSSSGPDGELTDEREEPIAADARPQGDGKESPSSRSWPGCSASASTRSCIAPSERGAAGCATGSGRSR